MMTLAADYEHDVIAWANEQARLLRSGQFAALDIEHLAEEIKAVGKLEQRERVNRLADAEWLDAVWADAVILAIVGTGMDAFPESCPWAVADILRPDWLLPGLG